MTDYGPEWQEQVRDGWKRGYPGNGAVLTVIRGRVEWETSAMPVRVCVVTCRRERGRDRLTFIRSKTVDPCRCDHDGPRLFPPGWTLQGWMPWEWETA